MKRAGFDTLWFPITGITFVSQILLRTDIDSPIGTRQSTHPTPDALLLKNTNDPILFTFLNGSCRTGLLASRFAALEAGDHVMIRIPHFMNDLDGRVKRTIVSAMGTGLLTYKTIGWTRILLPLQCFIDVHHKNILSISG
jgi:hypothetical protein